MENGSWYKERPGEVPAPLNRIEAADFTLRDPVNWFEIQWSDNSQHVPRHELGKYKVTLILFYDNLFVSERPEPWAPFQKVMPELMRSDIPEQEKYNMLGDVFTSVTGYEVPEDFWDY